MTIVDICLGILTLLILFSAGASILLIHLNYLKEKKKLNKEYEERRRKDKEYEEKIIERNKKHFERFEEQERIKNKYKIISQEEYYKI